MSKPENKLQVFQPSKFDRARAEKFDLSRANGNLCAANTFERLLNVDAEKRTADFAFASNKPIEHWFGFLILDTKKESVILDRVTSGVCPHLVNHNIDDQVGVVVKDSVKLGDLVRGTVKFSQSERGKEIFQDVIDEIRLGVSVGFLIHKMILESEQDGIPTYRAILWEVLETTSASIQADLSAGFGRSLEETYQNFYITKNETTEKRMEEDELENTPANPPAAAPPATQPAQTENRSTNTETVSLRTAREISAFGDLLGETELARSFIVEGKSVEEFRAALLAKRAASTPVPPVPAETAAQRQGENVQLARSVYRGGTLKAFRGKDGLVTAHRMGMWLGATLFGNEAARDFCRENNLLTRTQTGSQNELGGFLVPDEFENVMIDLRILYGIFRANANVVPMASETKSRPRRTGGLKAYPQGKHQKSELNWDKVELIARKWKVIAKYEEDFSEDAVINTADTLASEIAYAFAECEDNAGFNGDGSSDYNGVIGIINRIRNPHNASSLPAVGNVASLVQASGNTWDEITEADTLKVVGRLPQFARRSGSVKWYCSNEFWASVLERIILAKGGVTHAAIQGELVPVYMGKPVEVTEVMPHTEANSQIPLLYGNLSQSSMFGDRRGISIKSTDSNDTDFEDDVMTVKGSERFDIVNHDVGNADSTAGNRKAGPIVGLITQAS